MIYHGNSCKRILQLFASMYEATRYLINLIDDFDEKQKLFSEIRTCDDGDVWDACGGMFDDKKIHDLLLQANMLISKNKEESFAKIEEALALVKQGMWFSPHTKWQTINRFAG